MEPTIFAVCPKTQRFLDISGLGMIHCILCATLMYFPSEGQCVTVLVSSNHKHSNGWQLTRKDWRYLFQSSRTAMMESEELSLLHEQTMYRFISCVVHVLISLHLYIQLLACTVEFI